MRKVFFHIINFIHSIKFCVCVQEYLRASVLIIVCRPSHTSRFQHEKLSFRLFLETMDDILLILLKFKFQSSNFICIQDEETAVVARKTIIVLSGYTASLDFDSIWPSFFFNDFLLRFSLMRFRFYVSLANDCLRRIFCLTLILARKVLTIFLLMHFHFRRLFFR